MSNWEKAAIAAQILAAGGNVYGGIKAGKQRDKEYEDQRRRTEEDRARDEADRKARAVLLARILSGDFNPDGG